MREKLLRIRTLSGKLVLQNGRVACEELFGRFVEVVVKSPSWYLSKFQHSEEIQHAYFS